VHDLPLYHSGAGAAVEQARDDGATPLYKACEKGHLDVARLLLEASAVVDKAENDGQGPHPDTRDPAPTQRATETEREVRLRLHVGSPCRQARVLARAPRTAPLPRARTHAHVVLSPVRGLVPHLSEPTRRPRMRRLGLPPL